MRKMLRIARREYRRDGPHQGFHHRPRARAALDGRQRHRLRALQGPRGHDRTRRSPWSTARDSWPSAGRGGREAQREAESSTRRPARRSSPPTSSRSSRRTTRTRIAQRLELSDRVRRGELHAFVEIGPGVLHPARGPAMAAHRLPRQEPGAGRHARAGSRRPINNELRQLRLEEAGHRRRRASTDLFDWIVHRGHWAWCHARRRDGRGQAGRAQQRARGDPAAR